MKLAVNKLFKALTGKNEMPEQRQNDYLLFLEKKKTGPNELTKQIYEFIDDVSVKKEECIPSVNRFLNDYIKSMYDTE